MSHFSIGKFKMNSIIILEKSLNMYIKRDIDDELLNWKNSNNRKPLILRGVRQCGKTSAVRNLAKQFDCYIELNLDKNTKFHSFFLENINISNILQRLELEFSTRIIPNNTLIFIDEIQECPRAISVLRYFYEEAKDIHVIAAGSLLEFALNNKQVIDFPVGRVRSLFMYPFTFLEFLRGTRKEPVYDYLNNLNFDSDNFMHDKLLEEYKNFLIIGGMPEAVLEYVNTNSLYACQQIHRDIIINFMDDFNKYSNSISAETIKSVFNYCLHNVCSQIKVSSAINGISGYVFEECLSLLSKAGLIHLVKASSCETMPLEAGSKNANKKVLLFDTGVYLSQCGLDAGDILSTNYFDSLNKGDVVEMETGLELIKYNKNYNENKLYYWYRSGANAEIDYVINNKTKITPIEVKASNKGSMQSLHQFLKQFKDVEYGIRVSLENFATYDNIKVIPVYGTKLIYNL